MKTFRKPIAMLLCIVLTLSLVALPVQAATQSAVTPAQIAAVQQIYPEGTICTNTTPEFHVNVRWPGVMITASGCWGFAILFVGKLYDIDLTKNLSVTCLDINISMPDYYPKTPYYSARESVQVSKNPMDTLKMYSRDFVLQRQSTIRNNRDMAKAKQEDGKKLTEAEEALAFSKLRMEDREEIRILTDEEIARLRDVAYNGYFLEFTSRGGKPVRSGPYPLKQAKFFIFAMNVGLRKGELMALKYSDVDFDKKCITIKSNRTVAKKREAGGKATGGVNAVESSPKTKRSMAVIPVSELALQILRDMLAEETEGYNGYIANDGGKPLVESAFRRRFNSLLKQAHVEHCGLHTLRHTFASRLFAATNGNAKLVSELVRHSSVSFTEDIYIHLIEQTKANVLEDFSI